MSHTPTSFRRKTDGPHWAADAADTPNPARISCADPPDRFIHSCFFAIAMMRQGLQKCNQVIVGEAM